MVPFSKRGDERDDRAFSPSRSGPEAPKNGDFRIRKGVNAARWDGLREEPAPPGGGMTADRIGAPNFWDHRFGCRLPIRSVGWGEGTLLGDAPCPFSPFA